MSDLGKRFNREWIFRKLNTTFEAGTLYAITGANGSGKSTLLQVLCGHVPPTTGTVRYTKSHVDISVEDIYQHTAIATPYMDLLDEFTLTEQLQFHFKIKQSRAGMSIDDMIERMYLGAARHKFISNFSSGMRQRLKLALAFYTEASILYLDEPGTNLDQQAFEWYLSELQTLPAGCLTFVASNDPREYASTQHVLSILDYK